MFKSAQPRPPATGYVLVKCGKIALVLRLVCTYPIVMVWGNNGGLSELLLLAAVLTLSLTALLAWDRVAPLVVRHPSLVALDILLALLIFASANSPVAYTGYLGSTALLIGLFFTTLGQTLLTVLLAVGYVLIVALLSASEGEWVVNLSTLGASVVLFVSLTYVGRVMQRLQRQVNNSVQQARSVAAEAALGQERSRIARELHDSLVKSLEGIFLQAKAMTISGRAVEEASLIGSAAEQAIGESRQMLTGLREASVPPLAESLKTLVEEIRAMHGVWVDLQTTGCLELPLDLRHTARRIAEELLVNAAVHSGAERIVCSATAEQNELELIVKDDGRGFSQREELKARKSEHYGLRGVRERAEEVGGQIEVHSRHDQGTEVIFLAPVAG